jgi:GNAT superfamily N-acetyltransferase
MIDRWRADLAAETGVRRRALDEFASALGFDTSLPEEPAMAVIIRPVDSAAELITAFDAAGAQFDPAIDQRRFGDLEAAYPGDRELLLVAEDSGSVAGTAIGFVSSGSEVTLRILAVAAGRRRRGIGRALLRARGQRPASGSSTHLPGRRRRSRLLCPARLPDDAALAVRL